MTSGLTVSQSTVRRYFLSVQGLAADCKIVNEEAVHADSALAVIRQLQAVQLDSVSAVERNHHLVLAARLGPGYKPEWHNELLNQGQVFEYMANAACILPMEHYPFYEAMRRHFRSARSAALADYSIVAEGILARIREEGPLTSADFQSSERVHGFWDNKEATTKITSHVLNLLLDSAQICVVGRVGMIRTFDVTERAIPTELLTQADSLSIEEANEKLVHQYIKAYRIFELGDPRFGWARQIAKQKRTVLQNLIQQKQVVPLTIEGLGKPYYIVSEDVERLLECEDKPSYTSEALYFLPPLDNLLWRRPRLLDLFQFDYKWEIYTPVVKRTFGSYAMPIVLGDQIIGRMDPRLDRKRKALTILKLQLEPGIQWSDTLEQKLIQSLKQFALFHQAVTVEIQEVDGALAHTTFTVEI